MPVCHSDVAPLDRRITWVGDMFSLRPGNRMEMRFDVYTRTAADPTWRLVQAPDLGIWNRAKGGVSEYKFRQKAVNLNAPASYKARVTFDVAEQNKLLAQIHARMVDQASFLFVVHDVSPRAISPKVTGYVQAQSWYQDFTRITMAP